MVGGLGVKGYGAPLLKDLPEDLLEDLPKDLLKDLRIIICSRGNLLKGALLFEFMSPPSPAALSPVPCPLYTGCIECRPPRPHPPHCLPM